MFPDNPLLQLTLPRVKRAMARLEPLVWDEVAPVACSFAGAEAIPKSWEQARTLSYSPVELPFHWGKLFDVGWFKLELPKVTTKEPLYLHWNDQGEGTMYLDGVPYYGFEVAHRYCALPVKPGEIYIESLCLQSAIWHPTATGLDPLGSKLTKAALFTRNELAWDCLHDLRVLHEIALDEYKANYPLMPPKIGGGGGVGYHQPVDIVSPLYRRLLRTLDDAVNAFDQGGLPALSEALKAAYKKFGGQGDSIHSVLTGHAHIDLVWLWPERTAEYKATHTFSTMNRLMDLYPEFVFGYSQPASYDAVERISPKLMGQVKKRIASGKWEVLGATEVESDTLMACGEALARSFLLGQKGFNRIQGKPSNVLWIPDVFGYCGSLPQIMQQTGVDYFFTTKLTWSNINLFPYSSFVWKGIDGSEVIVHVTQENGYNQNATPEEIRRGARAYRQSDVHDEFLSPTGYGDGGGGVTEEMCERAKRLASLAGVPQTKWGRVDEFFDRLNKVRAKLPSWQGELYLEYHRGVLTTHGDLKARFRECERALQVWEAARCATGGGELDDHPWRRLVFAQFHDYIPGSSIWEVYEEGLPELKAISDNALASAAKDLGEGKVSSLFNPLPIERVHVLDDQSKAVRLAPLCGAPLAELPAVEPEQSVKVTTDGIESAQVAAKFNAKGDITSLAFGKNEIALRGPLNALMIFPDHPHDFEAWDIDRQTLTLGRAVDAKAEASVIAKGGLTGAVEFRRKLSEKSTVTTRYRLDAFQAVLHVEFDIDWHEEHALLKAMFPTAYTGRTARFGAPFGSVQRGQHAGQPRDEAMFESAASRWAIVGDDGDAEGLGVITEAKYGFSCRDGELGVSLLRSPATTGADPNHERLFPASLRRDPVISKYNPLFPSTLRRGTGREIYSDQGRHVIRLALCFQSPQTPRAELAATLADTLFTPPIAYTGAAVNAGFLGLEGPESLVPCWAKPAADGKGWILRLHETMGRRGKVRLQLAKGLQAFQTDLSESAKSKEPIGETSVSPYELLSFRIK